MGAGEATKWCSKCERFKPLDDFHNNKHAKDGKQSACKECNITRVKKWQADNAERFRASWATPEVMFRQRARRYGLTTGELSELIAKYGGVCPICKQAKELVVDHCHETGIVRGMLCHGCNVGLGMLGDSEAGLARALEYLRPTRIDVT